MSGGRRRSVRAVLSIALASVLLAPSASAQESSGEIFAKWVELGGPDSVVGDPVGGEFDVPGGRAHRFEDGIIYWGPTTGAHEVHGAILKRFQIHGEAGGVLRLPVTDEFTVPGGTANNFQGGAIYWDADRGGDAAHLIFGAIFERFHAVGGATHLGQPLFEEGVFGMTRPYTEQVFRKGSIFWTAGFGSGVSIGGINEEYRSFGGPESTLGMPISLEGDVPGGRAQLFQRGAMYWSEATRAKAVYGAILTRYNELGGSAGVAGFPTTIEVAGPFPAARFQIFERAYVYWSAGTGADAVRGGILQRYLAENAANGFLGLPINEEHPVEGGQRQDFQGGSIVWNAATGLTAIVSR